MYIVVNWHGVPWLMLAILFRAFGLLPPKDLNYYNIYTTLFAKQKSVIGL
jgi:hypothetical protein